MDENHSNHKRQFVCPTCKRSVKMPEDSSGLPKFFPFCCERCRLIDLGAWFDAEYRIPTKPDEEPDEPTPANPPAHREDSQE